MGLIVCALCDGWEKAAACRFAFAWPCRLCMLVALLLRPPVWLLGLFAFALAALVIDSATNHPRAK